jgi:poly(3-hydroxybutyrate) depolymerase
MPARTSLPLALCLLVTAAANAAYAPGDNSRSLESGGMARTYRVHVPPGYDGASAVPLVVDIHGLGSNASQQEGISGMRAMSDAHGFLVAYPQGLNDTFNAGTCCGNLDVDDVAFIRSLVAAVEGEATIDPSRVYVTGLSNGGAMTQRLACDAADLFAAAAPMAFPIPLDPRTECQPSRSMPVLTFMGLTDVLVRYNGQAFGTAPDTFAYWRDIDGCTGQPTRVDSGQSYCETYTSCGLGTQAGLCSITAQAFPGSPFSGHILYLNPDFNLAQVAWNFLSQFTLPAAAPAAEGRLSGTARFKLHGMRRRTGKVAWTVRLGEGTWAADDDSGTPITGSWSRSKPRAKSGTLTLGTEARTAFVEAAQKQLETLSGTTGVALTLENLAPLRVRLKKDGTPTGITGRWRIPSGDVPGAGAGTLSLKLRAAR